MKKIRLRSNQVHSSRAGTCLKFFSAFAAGALLATSQSISAADVEWIGGTSGSETDFNTGGNWDPAGVPGSSDLAIFGENAQEFSVTLSDDVTTDKVDVRDGTFSWDLGGNTYDVLSTANTLPNQATNPRDFGFMVAGNTEEVASLTITNGTLNTTRLLIGGALDSVGVVTLTGSNTIWNIDNGSNVDGAILGGPQSNGTGTLNIENGAQAILGAITLNRRPGSSQAFLNVTGLGSLLRITTGTAHLGLGDTGGATTVISDGAELDVADNLIINRKGTITVDAAFLNVGGDTRIGHNAGDGGVLTLQNGAIAELNARLQLGANEPGAEGGMLVTGGSTVTVTDDIISGSSGGTGWITVEDGSTLTADDRIFALGDGNGGQGTLTVRNPDTIMTVSSWARFGASDGSEGIVEVYDGATLSIGGFIRLAEEAGSQGTIRVYDGGQMSVGGVVDVGGQASGPGGSGLLEVRNGGHFQLTDPDDVIRVRHDGALAVEAGLVQAGNITFASDPGAIFSVTLATGHFDALVETTDTLDLGGAEIQLSLGQGFTADLGDVFVLMNYDDTGTLLGEFANAAQGSILSVGLYEFQIDYQDSSMFFPDQVSLLTVAIPEPGTALLFLATFPVWLLARRRRFRS